MYLNFSVDGHFATSRRCSVATAQAVLADLCHNYSVQSHTDGNLYGYTAGHGARSDIVGSWSLTKERLLETWSYQEQVQREHREARAARRAQSITTEGI
jgi:hypothetical protein